MPTRYEFEVDPVSRICTNEMPMNVVVFLRPLGSSAQRGDAVMERLSIRRIGIEGQGCLAVYRGEVGVGGGGLLDGEE